MSFFSPRSQQILKYLIYFPSDIANIIITYGQTLIRGQLLQSSLTDTSDAYGISTDGELLFIAAYGEHCILVQNIQTSLSSSSQLSSVTNSSPQEWGLRNIKGSQPGFFSHPTDVVIDGNLVYVVDCWNHRIQLFRKNGDFVSFIGLSSADNDDDCLKYPFGLAISSGFLFVSDHGTCEIKVFDLNGKFIQRWGRPGNGIGELSAPSLMASDSNFLFVCDRDNYRIQVFTHNGNFVRILDCRNIPSLECKHSHHGCDKFHPWNVKIGEDFLYVSDCATKAIIVFTKKGKHYRTWSHEGFRPNMSLAFYDDQMFVQQKNTLNVGIFK